jgi:pyruvate dehydrogenase E2 component (dihydrolipoamide acetyltransferase)
MPTDVIMPALGMAQETGKVVRWLKSDGDPVAKGEPLLEIETDKVTVEIEAPADGTLAGICAADGAEVPVGEAIAVVLATGEALASVVAIAPDAPVAAAPAAAPPLHAVAPARAGRSLASPKARRIAQERGIDLAALAGSGPGGAIVAADVGAASVAAVGANGVGSVWRLMAERTTHSWQTVPHFTLRREIDASRLRSWREAARAKPGAEGVSITDLLVKLVAESLRRHPGVNASWNAGSIVREERINVAIAVATDEALVAPVVHGADTLPLGAIAERRKELVVRARAGGLRPEDVSGGTFTISNLGMYGVDSFDAIVNAPQAAILAVARIVDRIVPLDGQAVVRPMLHLSISFDHRVVDGARGAEFLDTLASLAEEPAGLVA